MGPLHFDVSEDAPLTLCAGFGSSKARASIGHGSACFRRFAREKCHVLALRSC